MGTTTKQIASSKLKSAQSASLSAKRSSSLSKTDLSSPKTTESTTPPPSDIKSRACRTACPVCGAPKVPHATTCWGCYSGNKTSTNITLKCDCCGKEFRRAAAEHQKSLDRVGSAARVFCGRACYTQYKRENPLSYSIVKGSCLQCGAPVVGNSRQKFCSHSCYTQYRIRRKDSLEYGAAYLALKAQVSARDRLCAMCDAKKARMETHHVDLNSGNNTLQNLVLLCVPCHRKYHTLSEPVQRHLQSFFRTKIS